MQCLLLPVELFFPGKERFALFLRGLIVAEFVDNRLTFFQEPIAQALEADGLFGLLPAARFKAQRVHRLTVDIAGGFQKLEGSIGIDLDQNELRVRRRQGGSQRALCAVARDRGVARNHPWLKLWIALRGQVHMAGAGRNLLADELLVAAKIAIDNGDPDAASPVACCMKAVQARETQGLAGRSAGCCRSGLRHGGPG